MRKSTYTFMRNYRATKRRKKMKLTVAPMMKVTNYNFRRFFAEVFQNEIERDELSLYTEMLNVNFLLRGKRDDVEEALKCTPNSTILQVGGNCENTFRDVGRMLRERNTKFQGLNINAGCPSPRVSGDGCFGAALMRYPERLGRLGAILSETSGMSVSVKHRIGVVDRIDEMNDSITFENLANFVDTVHRSSQGTVRHFDVHSRCAVLNFNPKKNREIPPIRYDYVYDLIREFPNLHFSLNGEVCARSVPSHITDGNVREFMIGRAVQNHGPKTLDDIFHPNEYRLDHYCKAARRYLSSSDLRCNSRQQALAPLSNLFNGEKGARRYRRSLNESSDLHPLYIFNRALEEGGIEIDRDRQSTDENRENLNEDRQSSMVMS